MINKTESAVVSTYVIIAPCGADDVVFDVNVNPLNSLIDNI